MTNERELEQLQNAVKRLTELVSEMKLDVAQIRQAQNSLKTALDQAKGGWFVLLAVGAVATTIGANFRAIVDFIKHF